MKFLLGSLLYLALAQASATPPPVPSIEVRASTTNVSIGERFQVTVELRGPNGATYDFPKEIVDSSVELIHAAAAQPLARIAIYDTQVFAIDAQARIPEISIQYTLPDGSKGSVKSTPLALNVVSTLDPNEPNPAPADFAPPMPVLVSRAFWVTAALAALLVIALLVFLFRRLRLPKKPKDPSVTPAITPEEEALARLDELATTNAYREPKTFYIRLVQVLKQYLERRLEAPVLEMTTTETLAFVKAHSWTAPHAVAIRDLITAADLVKFGGSSDATNALRQIQLVRDLVGRVDRLRRTALELEARETDRRKIA
jgi:hypothetical protein